MNSKRLRMCFRALKICSTPHNVVILVHLVWCHFCKQIYPKVILCLGRCDRWTLKNPKLPGNRVLGIKNAFLALKTDATIASPPYA